MGALGRLPAELEELLDSLTDDDLPALSPATRAAIESAVRRYRPPSIQWWIDHARPAQLAPETFYLYIAAGGRGSGKTTGCTYWLANELLHDQAGDESAIVAPTMTDALKTNVEGAAGLLHALGTNLAEVNAGNSEHIERYNRSSGEVFMRSGAAVFCASADDGGARLQGHNFKRALCDEVQLWPAGRAEQTWDESLAPAVRLGTPQIAVALTPKSTPLVRRLLKDERAVIRRMTTFDNAANLAPEFLEQMKDRYEGTRIGRTQLYGELIEDTEGALWTVDAIERNRVPDPPAEGLIVATTIGLDPSAGSATGDEQGLAIVTAALDQSLYVVHSEGLRMTPLDFLVHAIRLSIKHNARMVIEGTYGDKPLTQLLDQAMRQLGVTRPYKVVKPSTSKTVRAIPVAALSEQDRLKIVGSQPALEEQMTTWTGAKGERSPNELDAMVHAATELMTHTRRPYPGDDSTGVFPYTDASFGPDAAVQWEDVAPDAGLGTFGWFERRHGL